MGRRTTRTKSSEDPRHAVVSRASSRRLLRSRERREYTTAVRATANPQIDRSVALAEDSRTKSPQRGAVRQTLRCVSGSSTARASSSVVQRTSDGHTSRTLTPNVPLALPVPSRERSTVSQQTYYHDTRFNYRRWCHIQRATLLSGSSNTTTDMFSKRYTAQRQHT